MQANSDTTLQIGPNASLTVCGAWWAFGGMATVSLLIAVVFTSLGFWPVLPFAGVEVAALGVALWLAIRSNRYREVLVFEADRVKVVFGEVGRGAIAIIEWPRAWVRVQLHPPLGPTAVSVLTLTAYGQAVTIGRCLTDAERADLLLRIKQLLPPVWCMPVPGASEPAPAHGFSKES